MHTKAVPRTIAQRFSIETTRPKATEIEAVAAVVPKGTELYITAVPTQTEDELVAAAANARRAGLEPVVHIAARRLPSLAMLQTRIARLRDEADVRRLLVIGGDIEPIGPFADALAVIQKGRLREAGIDHIGIGAYSEGHPTIPADRLSASLDEKIAAAIAQGLEVRLVSQFSFSPDDIVSWIKKLRAKGITQQISVGMVGPTSVPALIRFAKRCGVGVSLKGLMSGAASALIGNVGPDRIIEGLNAAQGTLGDVRPHYFTFGNLVATAEYGTAMARKIVAAA